MTIRTSVLCALFIVTFSAVGAVATPSEAILSQIDPSAVPDPSTITYEGMSTREVMEIRSQVAKGMATSTLTPFCAYHKTLGSFFAIRSLQCAYSACALTPWNAWYAGMAMTHHNIVALYCQE